MSENYAGRLSVLLDRDRGILSRDEEDALHELLAEHARLVTRVAELEAHPWTTVTPATGPAEPAIERTEGTGHGPR